LNQDDSGDGLFKDVRGLAGPNTIVLLQEIWRWKAQVMHDQWQLFTSPISAAGVAIGHA
jgi:hypothetical protein